MYLFYPVTFTKIRGPFSGAITDRDYAAIWGGVCGEPLSAGSQQQSVHEGAEIVTGN